MTHPLVKLFRKAKAHRGQAFAQQVVQQYYRNRYAKPSVEKYAATEQGKHWITIHPHPGAKGVHVEIDAGTIISGPAALEGQTLDDLHGDQQADTAETKVSPEVASDVKSVEESSTKQPWQQDLREFIPESKINDQAEFDKHRQAVEAALAAGEQVPENVLADYPDLQREQIENRQPDASTRTPEELTQVESELKDGAVSDRVRSPDSSANGVYIVTTENGTKGVFKPTAEERPNMRADIPVGSYADRAVAVYTIAKIVKLQDLVPVTTHKTMLGTADAPPQSGSIQEFVEDAQTSSEIRNDRAFDGKTDAARALVFDFIIGNLDRHRGNWLIQANGKMKLIDSDLCLPNAHSRQTLKCMAHQQNKLASHYKTLPLEEAKAAWHGKMPEIDAALEDSGISVTARDLMQQRYDIIMKAATWEEAIKQLERSTEGSQQVTQDDLAQLAELE